VIGIELIKQLRRARGWVTLGVIGLIPIVLTMVIGLTRPSIAERLGNWGSVVSNTSGLTIPLIALSALLLFMLPLGVAIFAGEPVASEAGWGSLRSVMASPVRRWRILGSKATVAAGYSIVAVVLVVLVGAITGSLAFGWRPLTVIDLQHTTAFHVAVATFSPWEALARTLLTVAFLLAMLASTFSFALLCSTLTSRSFSAVAGGVGLGLVSRALDNVPGLHVLSPWLPVTDQATTMWTGFFTSPMRVGGLGRVLAVQGVYSAVFLVAAFVCFARRDVLT
jgi:ABC-2 type transport system permease protein